MSKIARGVFILWVLAAAQLFAGTVYYVATNGNDSYNGLYASYMSGSNGPFRTLSHASAVVQAGDTLQIRGGTYQEKVNWSRSGTAAARITIMGYSGETAVIDGGYTLPGGSVYNFLVTVSGQYVTLRDVAIKHSSGGLLVVTGDYSYTINVVGEGCRETGMCATGNHDLFDACTMTDNGNGYGINGQTTWGSAMGGAPGAQNCTIQNCLVYNNKGEGINDSGTPNCTIQDNIVYDNDALGIYVGSASGTIVRRNLVYCSAGATYGPSSGIVISSEGGQDPAHFKIINNLCVGNWLNLVCDSDVTTADSWVIAYNTFVNTQKTAADISRGYNMGVYFRPQLVSFVNSIFKNNIIVEESSNQVPINTTLANSHPGFTFSNNCWNKTPTSAALGTGDVIANPMLAKSGSTAAGWLGPDWFKISDNSPATAHAVALSDVTDDFCGTARGSAPDMGAYEVTSSSAPLTASAAGSPTTGQAPLNVNFSGSVSGGTSPYTYQWTFGDGGTSTSQNPSHTYNSTGTFTATLTVKDNTGATSASTVSVNVAATVALSANLVGSPTSGQAPLAVTFSGSATGGASPYSYKWSFGDGSTSTAQNSSHTYSNSGTYAAALTVTDSKSATSTKSVTITANANSPALLASVTASPTSGQAPLAVTFSGSATGGAAPYTYSWTFGDGSSSTSQSPSHTYTASGTYTATLTVTDSTRTTTTRSVTITASAGSSALAASATASPTSGRAPLTVNFSGGATGGTAPYTYSWTFGDGSSSTSQNPSHIFSAAGTYTVMLAVTDRTGTTAAASVTISTSYSRRGSRRTITLARG